MNIFFELKDKAADELLQLSEGLPLQLTVMDIANFLGVSRTTAYKLVHSEGFPAIQFPGFKRLIIPKNLFLDWFIANMKKAGFEISKEAPDHDPAQGLAEKENRCYDGNV